MDDVTLRDAVADAVARGLDAMWDSWVSDTGCVPPEISIRGPRTTRVEADFRTGPLAEHATEQVLALLAARDDVAIVGTTDPADALKMFGARLKFKAAKDRAVITSAFDPGEEVWVLPPAGPAAPEGDTEPETK